MHQLADIAYKQGRIPPDQIHEATGVGAADVRALDIRGMPADAARRAMEITRQRAEHASGTATPRPGAAPGRATPPPERGREPGLGHDV